jgi:SOS-response transcriptional repressor LexA
MKLTHKPVPQSDDALVFEPLVELARRDAAQPADEAAGNTRLGFDLTAAGLVGEMTGEAVDQADHRLSLLHGRREGSGMRFGLHGGEDMSALSDASSRCPSESSHSENVEKCPIVMRHKKSSGGSFMVEHFRERVRERMSHLGLSDREVGRRVGRNPNWIKDALDAGPRSIKVDDMLKLAAALEVPTGWLLGGNADSFAPVVENAEHHFHREFGSGNVGLVTAVPVVGTAEEGAFRKIMVMEGEQATNAVIHEPRHNKFPHLPHYAVTQRGPSMEQRGINDGDIVIWVKWSDTGLKPINGLLVLVTREAPGGDLRETTIKEVDTSSGRVRLVPRSYSHRYETLTLSEEGEADNGVRIEGLILSVRKDAFPG